METVRCPQTHEGDICGSPAEILGKLMLSPEDLRTDTSPIVHLDLLCIRGHRLYKVPIDYLVED